MRTFRASIPPLVLTSLGETHHRLGDAAEAITLLTLAEEMCDEFGDRLHLAEAKRGLAAAYLMQGELKKARVLIKGAVDILGSIRSKSHLAVALRTLGEITAAGAWGDAHQPRAIQYFSRSVALCKEMGNDTEVARTYTAFSKYLLTSAEHQADPKLQEQARQMTTLAEQIFERSRIPSDSAGQNPIVKLGV